VVDSSAISNQVFNGSGTRDVKPPHTWVDKLNQKNGFYNKLEASVLAEGFRNPVFAISDGNSTQVRYGTSRLWMAKKHNLSIPVIIADYGNRWDDLEELFTEEDILSKFTDPPEVLSLTDTEMRIDQCPHSHLENSNSQ
jgi:hypothetical protein